MPDTLTDLTWDDVETWAERQSIASGAAAVIEYACRQRRIPDERWEAAKLILMGDADFYVHTGHEWAELRRLVTRIAYLVDLVQGEANGPSMDLTRVKHASRTSAPYSTVSKIDDAHAELGRAIDTWKQTL
ncbi:MAG TPA: hypothetical protein VFX13_11080 [Gaiellales bacterium]|nr:hypothetical protein [Gaiellales bacterium]